MAYSENGLTKFSKFQNDPFLSQPNVLKYVLGRDVVAFFEGREGTPFEKAIFRVMTSSGEELMRIFDVAENVVVAGNLVSYNDRYGWHVLNNAKKEVAKSIKLHDAQIGSNLFAYRETDDPKKLFVRTAGGQVLADIPNVTSYAVAGDVITYVDTMGWHALNSIGDEIAKGYDVNSSEIALGVLALNRRDRWEALNSSGNVIKTYPRVDESKISADLVACRLGSKWEIYNDHGTMVHSAMSVEDLTMNGGLFTYRKNGILHVFNLDGKEMPVEWGVKDLVLGGGYYAYRIGSTVNVFNAQGKLMKKLNRIDGLWLPSNSD
jgi:hypothetical protein